MKNFFLDDKFCSDLSDLMDAYDWDEEDLQYLSDDWKVEVMDSTLEKIFQFKMSDLVGDIIERTDRWEERFPEESTDTFDALEKAIASGIDLEKINAAIPSLYYPADKSFTITKQDLIDYCK